MITKGGINTKTADGRLSSSQSDEVSGARPILGAVTWLSEAASKMG